MASCVHNGNNETKIGLSHSMAITFSDNNGDEIEIAESSKLIEIWIPRDLNLPAVSPHYVNISKKENVVSEIKGKLEKAVNIKSAKRLAGEMAQDANYTTHERETTKHIINIKNKNSELPTFELKFKKIQTTFEAAWKDGATRLVKIAADKIREKQNLKLVVGVECLIVKPREDEETEKTIHAHTMPESV